MGKPSPEEVEGLRSFFSAVLELPEELMVASRQCWEGRALVCRSLGRRLPVEWVVNEVQRRMKMSYRPEGFGLAEEFLVLRFQSPEDCDRVAEGGPWLVAGQLLAMEPWSPDFVPGSSSVRRATVWLRLPGLPLEYWTSDALRAIAATAGRPLEVDGYTEACAKAGFARIRMEIDVDRPLVPGVLIKGQSTTFWQAFVFENLPSFCFACGRLGHSEGSCPAPASTAAPSAPSSEPGGRVRPRLGPWLVAQRVRPPRPKAQAPPSSGGQPSAATGSGPSPPPGGRRTEPYASPPGGPYSSVPAGGFLCGRRLAGPGQASSSQASAELAGGLVNGSRFPLCRPFWPSGGGGRWEGGHPPCSQESGRGPVHGPAWEGVGLSARFLFSREGDGPSARFLFSRGPNQSGPTGGVRVGLGLGRVGGGPGGPSQTC